MPGKVAVWTTEHDPACKTRTKVPSPAATFTQDELRNYPIIVVTHAFYNGAKGNKANLVKHNGLISHRGLILVDERPEDVDIYEITFAEAETVREQLQTKVPAISEYLYRLVTLMMLATKDPTSNHIYRPAEALGQSFVENELYWFADKEADTIAKRHSADIRGLDQLFGFAKALTRGCAFSVASSQIVRFVGWQPKMKVHPGTVLLDATADIDGVTALCPWRQHTKVPQASYENLEIIHVPQHTKRRLSEYLKTAPNQRAYVKWLVEIVKEHMAPGERGLVVCKKKLIDDQRVPNWPDGDARFEAQDSFTKDYAWDVEGRSLCVTHWGTGIGSNDWKDADAVFLLDEFFLPRRVSAAHVQALKGHRANEGDLAAMKTLNSRNYAVDLLAEGHRLRWTKQMALRGHGRSYDQHGVCGKQRLVISSDLKSFTANVGRLFPGATNIELAGDAVGTWTDKVLKALSDPQLPSKLTTRQLGRLVGRDWRLLRSNIIRPGFERSIDALGWRYVPVKGRGGSYFERTTATTAQAA